MTYQETCDYLFHQTPSFEKSGKTGFNEGLAVTLALDAHYGHPHRHFKTIHVAGTNGKGSVSHTLAAHLQAAGYRVGLYTSPHLVDFRERIRINGQPIPQSYIVDFVADFLRWSSAPPSAPAPAPLSAPAPAPQSAPAPTQAATMPAGFPAGLHPSFFDLTTAPAPAPQAATMPAGFPAGLHPSFFELTTALAFTYFRDLQVDIAVIEVGLGGRLDCTNIITPILSVITNISLDHTDMLGDTMAKIATEKAGIIKEGIPVVIGETHPETRPVFEAKAAERHAPVIFADDTPLVRLTESNNKTTYETADGTTFEGDLRGIYQEKNTNTALCALHQLQQQGIIDRIDYNVFMHVGETTGLMARWQKLQDSPTIVCDTGHNVGGWEYLSRQLAAVKCHHMHIVFGMVSDKDVHAVMRMLPKQATYYYTKAPTHRAIDEHIIQQIGDSLGLTGHSYSSVYKAVNAALQNASESDFIFIGGSTYVVAEYLKTRI